jgi:microcystin-dependent protein
MPRFSATDSKKETPMPAPPLKSAVSGTPTRATANAGFGALYDYLTGLLGATGDAAEARTALVVPTRTGGNASGTWGIDISGNAASATTADNGVSPGAVIAFARNTAPTGFLKANGALVSRTTYAALFSAIGTAFGAGNGSSTFGLPDMRGEFLRGWDDGRGVDSGRAFGSAQADELKSHRHTLRGNTGGEVKVLFLESDAISGIGSGGSFEDTPNTMGSTGGAETRPRNIAMLFCIKF